MIFSAHSTPAKQRPLVSRIARDPLIAVCTRRRSEIAALLINIRLAAKSRSVALVLMLFLGIAVQAQQPSPTAFTYQGTLTHFGAPVGGVYDFQFILRDAPLNGNVIGTKLVPQIVVSNGLFAATLDYGSGSFPGAPRYLEVDLRTNGSTGAYSVLSPAQPVNPSPYAIQTISATSASFATNAIKLAGYDWSSILVGGGNDPTQGQIAANKIQTGGITGQQIANGTIGPGQLTSGAVNATNIAPGAVGTLQIAAGAIQNSHLAEGVVAPTNLLARQIGTNVGIGGIGISGSSGNFQSPHNDPFVDVTNLTVTIVTTGRPVQLMILPAPGAPAAFVGGESDTLRVDPFAYFKFSFDGQDLQQFDLTFGGSCQYLILPPGCLNQIHFPVPAGTHTYKLRAAGRSAYDSYAVVFNCVLAAFEL